jgi:hypothetical protein
MEATTESLHLVFFFPPPNSHPSDCSFEEALEMLWEHELTALVWRKVCIYIYIYSQCAKWICRRLFEWWLSNNNNIKLNVSAITTAYLKPSCDVSLSSCSQQPVSTS